MKENNCILINLMGICSGDPTTCLHYSPCTDNGCFYHCNGRCCHAVAIVTATRKDRRGRDELKHLLNGGGI